MPAPRFAVGDAVTVEGFSSNKAVVVTDVARLRPERTGAVVKPLYKVRGVRDTVDSDWFPESRLLAARPAPQEYDVTVKVRVCADTPAGAMHTVSQVVPAAWVRSAEVVV